MHVRSLLCLISTVKRKNIRDSNRLAKIVNILINFCYGVSFAVSRVIQKSCHINVMYLRYFETAYFNSFLRVLVIASVIFKGTDSEEVNSFLGWN